MLPSNNSYAQVLKCSKKPVHIHYLNGMFNSLGDASDSKEEIRKILVKDGIYDKITWTRLPTVNFSHNRSYLREAGYDTDDQFTDLKSSTLALMDFLEVADQKLQNYAEAFGLNGLNTWEEIANSYYGLKYTTKHPAAKLTVEAIALLMKSQMVYKEEDTQKMMNALRPFKDSKDKVIVVSHSQGNLHANETFIRLFPDYQVDYPFERPLDISNDQFIGNLWGNFQIASPNLIISNPRNKTMRFVQDEVFNKLGQTGQLPTNLLLDIPDGQPQSGEFNVLPDNDTNFHTFLLYTSSNYRSALVCAEGPCPGTTKTNREHFIDRMQEIAQMLPSNCGEIQPVVTSKLINASATNKIIKNYTKVELNYENTLYGTDINGLDPNGTEVKLLLSGFKVGDQVSRSCLNNDDNPYFCDEPLDRSPASVDIISTSLPDISFQNTFGENKDVSLASVIGQDKVYNGNEDIFAPEVIYNGPYEFQAGIAKKVYIEAVDLEFPSSQPTLTGVIGDNLVIIPDQPDRPSEMIKLKVGAIGKLGAKKELSVDVLVHYCQGLECNLRLQPEFPVVEIVENLSTGYSPDGAVLRIKAYYPSLEGDTSSERYNYTLKTTMTVKSLFGFGSEVSRDSYNVDINLGGITEFVLPLHQPSPGSGLSYLFSFNLPKSNGLESKEILAGGLSVGSYNCLNGYAWSYKLRKCGKIETTGPSFVCTSALTSNSNPFYSQRGWNCAQEPYHGSLVPIEQGLNWNGLSTGYVASHCTDCAYGPNGEPPPKPSIPEPLDVSLSGTWYDYVNDIELPWSFSKTIYFAYP